MSEGLKKVYLVGFAGIPGCGKSSAIKLLERSNYLQEELKNTSEASVVFVQEPSDLWRQRGWLQAFYANPSKNAAAFQMLVFDSYIDAVLAGIERGSKSANPGREGCQPPLIVVVERTFYCQRLFWEQQVESGCESASGMFIEAYEHIWRRWRSFVPEPSLVFLFQTTDIQTTMRRVQTRARAEELGLLSSSTDNSVVAANGGDDPIQAVGGLTLDYQQRLLKKHQEWFNEPVAHPLGCETTEGIPCAHVNVDKPYHTDDNALRELAANMAKHIKGILK
jgi:thymidylate kinase